MLRADDARIQNARGTSQRIDGRINTAFDDLTAEVGSGVQMRESGRRGRIRVVIGGNVDGLHRGDRTGLRRSDALLQFTDFRIEVRLVADGRWHAAKERRNLRTRLHK